MKNFLMVWIAVILLGVQGVSGFSVSSITVNPSGDLMDGTSVTVTCEIPRTGILLYDQLVLTTDLDSPVWDPVVMVRDKETPVNPASAHGNTLTLNGALYNYPSSIPVKVRVNVQGSVPPNHTANQRLLDIRQLDAEGTEYAYPSGYSLPMPGSPPPGVMPETAPAPALPAENQVSEDTVPATPAPVPSDSPPVTTVPATTKNLPVPTAWPDNTPDAAAPAGLPSVVAAVGITIYCMRQKRQVK